MCDSILEATHSPKSKKDAMMSAPGEGAYHIEMLLKCFKNEIFHIVSKSVAKSHHVKSGDHGRI
jgi:hypothetical protein